MRNVKCRGRKIGWNKERRKREEKRVLTRGRGESEEDLVQQDEKY